MEHCASDVSLLETQVPCEQNQTICYEPKLGVDLSATQGSSSRVVRRVCMCGVLTKVFAANDVR